MALTAPNVIGENSAATPGLWNSPITTLWQDILALQSSHTGLISTNTISPESGNTILMTSSVLSTNAIQGTVIQSASTTTAPLRARYDASTLWSVAVDDTGGATYSAIGSFPIHYFPQDGLFGDDLTVTDQLIVQGNASMQADAFVEGTLDVGGTVTTSAQLAIQSLTQQLSLEYDATNHLAVTVGSTGGVTFNATGTGASFTFSDAVTLSAALTYGGVTLANAVTGTGNMVLSASPTLTGTITLAAATASGLITADAGVVINGGTFAAGSIFKDTNNGLVFQLITGVNKDFGIRTADNSAFIVSIPTGSDDWEIRTGDLLIDAAAARIIPGATSFAIRNNANGADNLLVTDAGALTARTTITASTGLTVTTGNSALATVSASGLISANAGIGFATNGSVAAGQINKNATFGLALQGITGTQWDFTIFNAAGGNALTMTPGTSAWVFSGAVSGITTLAGTGAVSGFTSAAFSGVLSTTSSLAIAAAQKFYLDGVAVSGDTYIHESAANNVIHVVGGANALTLTATTATFVAGVVLGGPARLKGYTVATLPAGTQGDTAFVTDALAPAFLTALVGGGAVVTPCFYDGTNWVAI